MSIFAAGTWTAIAAGTSAAAGVYSAVKGANQAGQSPAQRNLGGEIGTITGQLPGVAQAGYNTQQQFGGLYNALGNTNLQSGLLGGIDANRFIEAHPEFQQGWAENNQDPAWLQRAINAASYIQPNEVPRTGDGLLGTLGSAQSIQDRQNATSSTFQRTGNLADMQALAPGANALQRQLNPEYYNALGSLNTAAGQSINASPYETALGQQALGNPASFTNGAVRDVNAPGAGDSVTAQQVNYNPAYQAAGTSMVRGPRMDSALSGALGSVANGEAGSGPLQAELQKQALAQLQTNGAITQQESQQARNEARAAAEARGLSYSPGAMADEILNLDKYRRQRSDANQTFAANVDAQGFAQRQQGLASTLAVSDAARGYAGLGQQAQLANQSAGLQASLANQGARLQDAGMGLQAQQSNQSANLQASLANQGNRLQYDQLGLQGQLANQSADITRNTQGLNAADFGLRSAAQRSNDLSLANAMQQSRSTDQFNRLGSAAQLSSANLYDPASVLGSVDNRLNSTTTLGMGQQQFQGAPDYLSQLLGYGSDVNNTNYNGAVAANLNSANAYSSLGGGLLSAAGSIGAAYLSK